MKRLFAGAIMFAMSLPAMAESPSYNFLQLDWRTVEFDAGSVDVDGDGLGISGAFEIAPNWHIVAGYSSIDLDAGVDFAEFGIGAGYHSDISNNTNFFANLLWVTAEVDVNGFGSVDESGVGAQVGLRSNVTDAVQLEGFISYVDLGDGADGTSVGGAGWYSFNDQFALGLLAEFDDDVTSFGIGGRMYFGD